MSKKKKYKKELQKIENIKFDKNSTMNSYTFGEISLDDIIEKIAEFTKDSEYEITVGTDSQNFSVTKMVLVVCIHKLGKGGIFFYKQFYIDKVRTLKDKIEKETQLSLEFANSFNELLMEKDILCDIDIHLDIGKIGKTSQLIKEITSWVRGCGYRCEIKPDSYTASGIADKLSK